MIINTAGGFDVENFRNLVFTKPETLTSTTAAMFGLTPATAVPDDVLAWLGRYAKYFWRRRPLEYTAEEKQTDVATNYKITDSNARTIQYSSQISINPVTLEISLVNPQDISVTRSTGGTLAALAPCYITNLLDDETGVHFLPTGTNFGTSNSYTLRNNSSPMSLTLSTGATTKAKDVSATQIVTYGEWETVSSTDRSAYPDSGIEDGYDYEYIGIPFENLPTAPKIEFGSYIGTGTYGSSNKNSLTFGFAPKLVIIRVSQTSTNVNNGACFLWISGMPTVSYTFGIDAGSDTNNAVTVTGTKIEWYSPTSPTYQFNYGNTYDYVAFG